MNEGMPRAANDDQFDKGAPEGLLSWESGGNSSLVEKEKILERLGFRLGQEVSVQRSSGEVETDWHIEDYHFGVSGEDDRIVVTKLDTTGDTLKKSIPPNKLLEWNS